MKFKKTITMATLAAMIGIPALGITNNAHAASNNINQKVRYLPEGPHGEYEPVFNNGNGPVDDIGDKSMPKNLTQSQADALNSGQTVNGFNEYNNKLYSNGNSQIKSNQTNNNQTQYTKNSLPQTNESHNNTLLLAAMFSMTGIGFMALDMVYKRRYNNSIESKCNDLFKQILINNLK